MRHRRFEELNNLQIKFQNDDFQNWLPNFQRLGLKPRRYFRENEAIFFGTIDGWYRLGLKKYSKQELKWLRSILEYLHERSFQNWAVPWQKTMIWEENTCCYLIQPWLLVKDYYQANDPASISRIAEISTDFYNCGKDYRELKGIEIERDHWQSIDLEWETALNQLEQYNIHSEHEKPRKELDELRRNAINLVTECLNIWRKSCLSTLFEHHHQSGVIGHGNLLVKNIIWCGNDYYFLNWEGIAFQPRVADIATLINDVSWWETDWIIFMVNEFSKILPFWSEEYSALLALLKYPQKIIPLFTGDPLDNGLDGKNLKEVARELAKKERCLTKAWKELGTRKRWAWNREIDTPKNQGKISMVLSPVETWGYFPGQIDSLIQVTTEQKLPTDVIERLSYSNPDRVVAGRDGNILESAAKPDSLVNQNNFIEIVEPLPKIPDEKEILNDEETLTANEPTAEIKTENSSLLKNEDTSTPIIIVKNDEKIPEPGIKKTVPHVVRWSNFPKPVGEKSHLG